MFKDIGDVFFWIGLLAFGVAVGVMLGISEGKTVLINKYCTADSTISLAARDECIDDMQQYK